MAPGRFHRPDRFPGQPDGRLADGNWELSLRPVTAYRSPRLGGRDPILPTQTAATIGLSRTDWAARDVKRLPIPGMLPITLRPSASRCPARRIWPFGTRTAIRSPPASSQVTQRYPQSQRFFHNASIFEATLVAIS